MFLAAPYKGYAATKVIMRDVRSQLTSSRPSWSELSGTIRKSTAARHKLFNNLSITSPMLLLKSTVSLSFIYNEVHQKQEKLKSLRKLQAAALGLLVGEGMNIRETGDWRKSVENGVNIIETILKNVCNVNGNAAEDLEGL